MPTELSEEELASLASLVASKGIDPEKINTSLFELENYYRDMGEPPGVFCRMLSSAKPQMLIQPTTPRDLSHAVKILYSNKIPFTPRGLGSTGLGGAVPVDAGAIIDLSKMSGIVSIDEKSATIRVLAGTTFYRIQSAISPYGLELLSRPSNAFGTIGGWAAGGGLGLGSLKADSIVEQVNQIEVVYPDGSLDGLVPSSEGFKDFFRTEGQLGIFASLTLQAKKHTATPSVLALCAPSMSSTMDCVKSLLEHEKSPTEITLLGKTDHHPELSADTGWELILATWAGQPGSLRIPPSVVTLPERAAGTLWNKRFFPMDSHLGPIFLASEALVPLDMVENLTKAARKRAAKFKTPLLLHGHAVKSEGRLLMLMLFMFPCDPQKGWNHLMLTPLAAILTSVANRKGGRPYGLGVWNTPFAKNSFGAKRMMYLREKKKTLDPLNLCNPGKFFKVGAKAKALPLIMAKGVYPAMLTMASGMGPLLAGSAQSDKKQKDAFRRCVWCGACVSICPAVAVTGSESVSARSKLSLMKKIQQQTVSDKQLKAALQCLACGQCQEVCARGLDLLGEFKKLEYTIRSELGDENYNKCIEEFADLVDTQTDRVLEVALP